MSICFYLQVEDAELGKIHSDPLNNIECAELPNKPNAAAKHHGIHSHTLTYDKKYRQLVPKLFSLIQQVKEETGSPGLRLFLCLLFSQLSAFSYKWVSLYIISNGHEDVP